jgi:hypothetical protein
VAELPCFRPIFQVLSRQFVVFADGRALPALRFEFANERNKRRI